MIVNISADDILIFFFFFFFSYFSQKISFDISCKLSAKETVRMKCHSLFSGKKNQESLINLSSAESQ